MGIGQWGAAAPWQPTLRRSFDCALAEVVATRCLRSTARLCRCFHAASWDPSQGESAGGCAWVLALYAPSPPRVAVAAATGKCAKAECIALVNRGPHHPRCTAALLTAAGAALQKRMCVSED